jgi:3-isopropylmalate dehydrogenase
VYQTNHGAAHDLAGTDRANPIGQVLSLGMLIRETMGSAPAANAIERAVQDVLQQGYRTFDISEEGCHIVGTRELGERIADQIRMMKSPVDDEIAGAVAN